MSRKHRPLALLGTMALAATFALWAAAPAAHASNQVGITLNAGGTLTASIADVTLAALTYSHAEQTQTGDLVLTVDDPTGSGAGWHIDVSSSAFTHSGGGPAIPATAFEVATADTPVAVVGQAVDATEGPLAGSTGSLDQARKVIYANAGYGQGQYTQALGVELTIPGYARAGTYSATLTVTAAAGPDA